MQAACLTPTHPDSQTLSLTIWSRKQIFPPSELAHIRHSKNEDEKPMEDSPSLNDYNIQKHRSARH